MKKFIFAILLLTLFAIPALGARQDNYSDVEATTGFYFLGRDAVGTKEMPVSVLAAWVPTVETDPVVGAVTGIVKADGAGTISAAGAEDIPDLSGTYLTAESDPTIGTLTTGKWCTSPDGSTITCEEDEPAGAGDDLGSATYSDVTALWATGSCSGYLKSDGSCDTPGGDVSKVDTPADHEFGVWTGDGTLAGVAVTGSNVVCTDADGEPVACSNLTDVAIPAAQDAVTLSGDPINAIFSLSTQAMSLDTQTAATVLAGPTTGDPAAPAFRPIAATDIPDLSGIYQVDIADYTVATLPAEPTAGDLAWVTDGVDVFDCTAGDTGSERVLCSYDGSGWVAVGNAPELIDDTAGDGTDDRAYSADKIIDTYMPFSGGTFTDPVSYAADPAAADGNELVRASWVTDSIATHADNTTTAHGLTIADVVSQGDVFQGQVGTDGDRETIYGDTVYFNALVGADSDGSNKLALPNNTTISPTADSMEIYPEGNVWKMNANGTERQICSLDGDETLTTKTIDADDNTLQDLPQTQTFVILDPANGDDPLVWRFSRSATITRLDCVSLGGGDIDVDMQECDSNGANGASGGIVLTDVTTTDQNDTSFTDAAFDADDYMQMVLTNQAGTVDQLSCTVQWTETW